MGPRQPKLTAVSMGHELTPESMSMFTSPTCLPCDNPNYHLKQSKKKQRNYLKFKNNDPFLTYRDIFL